jgi:hypothetical protein
MDRNMKPNVTLPMPELPVIFKGEIPPPSLPAIKMSTILIAAMFGFTAVIVIICLTQPASHLVDCFKALVGSK